MNAHNKNITHYSSALPFIDQQYRSHLSPRFREVLDSTEVDLDKSARSQLKIRASSVDDWWFSWFEGKGNPVVTSGNRVSRLSNHVWLIFTLHGQHYMGQQQAVFPPPGTIGMNLWGKEDISMSSGNFAHFCIYIPQEQVHALVAQPVPYGCFVPACSGSGAILGATISKLVTEALWCSSEKKLSALLPSFLSFAVSALNSHDSGCGGVGSTSPRMQAILHHLEEHLGDPELTPEFIAERVGISRRQLFREFESLGDTYSNRLKEMRLSRAKQLLGCFPHVSITEVAYDCGFSSPTVFGRMFRHAFDLSPREYQNLQKSVSGSFL